MAARKSVVETHRAAIQKTDARLTHILISKNGYWGRGETEAEALHAYNSIVTPKAIDKDMMVWLCNAETRINEHGGLVRPKGDPEPTRIQ